MELALEWAETQEQSHKITICLDSKALVDALTSNPARQDIEVDSIRHRLDTSQHKFAIQWVPGHSGLVGNEWVDQAAKNAATDPALEACNSITWRTAAKLARQRQPQKIQHPLLRKTYGTKKSQQLSTRRRRSAGATQMRASSQAG